MDIRVGRVVSVEDSATKKPTYRITVDFGPEIGKKRTCGAYRNYSKEELEGKLVVGLINVGIKKMGSEMSEFLLLGVANGKGDTIYLMPQCDVQPGVTVFA